MKQEVMKAINDVVVNTHTGLEVVGIERISALVTTPETSKRLLNLPDLTEVAHGGTNPVSLVLDRIISSIGDNPNNPPVIIHRGARVVSTYDNFDNLLFPTNAAARLPQYVRYVDDSRVFRTHTSALVPEVLRQISQVMSSENEDVIIAVPGITFRRDVIDNRHTEAPHQLDLWRIRRIRDESQRMDRRDLVEIVTAICRCFRDNPEIRFNETSHPYTLNGVEVEIKLPDGTWMEILEAGELNPDMLRLNGIGYPEQYTGWAIGMGLDRLAMYAKGIGDIRTLRATDPRIVRQFGDLKPFKEIPGRPPFKRKVSLTAGSLCDEDFAERVREMDSELFGIISGLSVAGSWEIDSLDDEVVSRLGATRGQGQKNYLLQIEVNPLERVATDEEANGVVQVIYDMFNITRAKLPPFKVKTSQKIALT